MTVTEGQILTVESIPKYIDDHNIIDNLKGIIDSTEGLQVKAIMGGNVNYAFCLTTTTNNNSNNKTVFLKQAPEFVAIFGPDGFPLTSERMQREMDVYKEWKIILSKQDGQLDQKYLPDIYNFDKSYMCVLMEFLDGHELLDHILVDKDPNLPKEVAINLGDFMGRTHAKTHSSNTVDVNQDRIDYLTKHFENREMRDIQLEFVFTKCFKEATDEQRAGLELTPEFMKEIELLKSQYDATHKPSSNNLVLTHGDFHPGSVMVNPTTGSTKVIDPEFTIYGPPGLDVGSLLSGYCLGAIHQAYSNNKDGGKRIVESMKDIWDAYLKAFKECMPENCINDELMKEIEIQTVGFTLIEVCRTALEFAGGRKWLQFDDVSTKASSKKAALRVVDKCMVGRNDGGIQLMFDEISKVVSEV